MFHSLKALRARASAQAASRKDLAERTRRILALAVEDALSVNEIACADPGCPDVETVILLMLAGRPTRAVKIAKPMETVTEADILEAACGTEPP